MIDLYLSAITDEKDDNMHVYLLESGFSYLNKAFETNLKVNYNYKSEEFAGEDVEADEILHTLALERTISSKKASPFRKIPYMKVLTNRRTGTSRQLKCPEEHGPICHCGPQMKFRSRFFGLNIYAIFVIEEQAKCLVCNKELKRATLQLRNHFQNDCETFNPKPMRAEVFEAWQDQPVRELTFAFENAL